MLDKGIIEYSWTQNGEEVLKMEVENVTQVQTYLEKEIADTIDGEAYYPPESTLFVDFELGDVLNNVYESYNEVDELSSGSNSTQVTVQELGGIVITDLKVSENLITLEFTSGEGADKIWITLANDTLQIYRNFGVVGTRADGIIYVPITEIIGDVGDDITIKIGLVNADNVYGEVQTVSETLVAYTTILNHNFEADGVGSFSVFDVGAPWIDLVDFFSRRGLYQRTKTLYQAIPLLAANAYRFTITFKDVTVATNLNSIKLFASETGTSNYLDYEIATFQETLGSSDYTTTTIDFTVPIDYDFLSIQGRWSNSSNSITQNFILRQVILEEL